MTTTTPSSSSSSSSASSTLPRRLPGARGFVRGSVYRGPRASSIRGRSSSLAGCVASGPRSRIRVVVVRRSWSSCGRLLSFLGGWDHLHEGNVVAGGCGLALGAVSRLWAIVVGAWWLWVEEALSHKFVTGIINVQLAREINNNLWCSVWWYFKPLLSQTRHPNPSVRIHPILGIFLIGTLIRYMLKYYRNHNLILFWCYTTQRKTKKLKTFLHFLHWSLFTYIY